MAERVFRYKYEIQKIFVKKLRSNLLRKSVKLDTHEWLRELSIIALVKVRFGPLLKVIKSSYLSVLSSPFPLCITEKKKSIYNAQVSESDYRNKKKPFPSAKNSPAYIYITSKAEVRSRETEFPKNHFRARLLLGRAHNDYFFYRASL